MGCGTSKHQAGATTIAPSQLQAGVGPAAVKAALVQAPSQTDVAKSAEYNPTEQQTAAPTVAVAPRLKDVQQAGPRPSSAYKNLPPLPQTRVTPAAAEQPTVEPVKVPTVAPTTNIAVVEAHGAPQPAPVAVLVEVATSGYTTILAQLIK